MLKPNKINKKVRPEYIAVHKLIFIKYHNHEKTLFLKESITFIFCRFCLFSQNE
jgi:hypothetical protein